MGYPRQGWDETFVFPGPKAGTTCSNNTLLKLLKVDMARKATCTDSARPSAVGPERNLDRARSARILPAPYGGSRGRTSLCPWRLLGQAQGRVKEWEGFCNSKATLKSSDLKLVA